MRSDRRIYSTKHFSWIHVPKTGGTWMHGVLTKHAPASWEASFGPPAHVRLHEVPMALEHWNKKPGRVGLPIVATVRNPWDWYVSAYFFLEQHRVNGTGGFAVPPASRPAGLIQWEKEYAKGNNVRGFRLAMPAMLEAMHTKASFKSIQIQTLYLRLADGSVGVNPVRFENIRQGMVEKLEELGAEVTPQLRSALTTSPKVNTSGHASYRDCYDDMTRKLVEKYDGWLIDSFGYTF